MGIARNLDRGAKRAKRQPPKVSLKESIRRVLKDSESGKKPSKKQLIALLNRIAAMSPPITEPPYAEDLIREDRDSR
jgi:hypothetical protein